MSDTFRYRAALCVLFITYPSVVSQAQESRIWTDITGKHEIRAKFVDLDNGMVRLERPNGDLTRIPLEKLSKDDQAYVQSGAAAEPQQAKVPPQPEGLQIGDRIEAEDFGRWEPGKVVEIDYKWGHVTVRLDSGRMAEMLDTDELRYPGTNRNPVLVKPPAPESALRTIRPNYDGMSRLVADDEPEDRLTADPKKENTISWKARSVRLSGPQDFFESPSDFEISSGTQAIAMVIYANQHDDEAFPRVELLDMKSGKVVANGPAPRGTGQLAMSPSGSRVVTFPGEFADSEHDGTIHFWKLSGTKVEHWIGFAPYVMNTWPDVVPTWAMWLDEDRLFTVNREGQLILWDVAQATAIYELSVDRSVNPILSPGRKYLVVPTQSGIQFYHADTGKSVARLGTENFTRAALAFSPSGRQLAIATHGFIDVLDITTGTTTSSFTYDPNAYVRELAWIDEDYLFTDQGLLIHVPLRLIAWKFEFAADAIVRPFAGTFWTLLQNQMNNSQLLTPLKLPPPEAVDAVKGLNAEDLLAVRPGDAVTLDVQIHQDSALARDVESALRPALEQAGLKVSPDQALKLVASMKDGETQEIIYRPFHSRPDDQGEQMSVTNRVYELQLLRNGAVIWKRNSVHSAPHILHMQEGETTRAALDRVMTPTAANFRGRLPAYVVRPEYAEPLGTTSVKPGF